MQGVDFIFYILILLMSVIVHELSHGYVANLLGDPTAKYAGRLTLNPLKHLDFVGSFLLPFLLIVTNAGFLFGWAKPVPYNPYNLKMSNQKLGGGIVAIAGPISNFLIAGVFSLLVNYSYKLSFLTPDFLNIATMIIIVNVSLACFNLVPIPPLDGSKVLFGFLPRGFSHIEDTLEKYGFLILILFIMFFSGIISPIINTVLHFFL